MARALLVVDMLNDFVTGKIANPRAEKIIPNIASLVEMARSEEDWLVVYANDAHLPGDFELKDWGEHAMAGTQGAEIIPELAAAQGEVVLPKRVYSSFHETGLDPLLRQHWVDITRERSRPTPTDQEKKVSDERRAGPPGRCRNAVGAYRSGHARCRGGDLVAASRAPSQDELAARRHPRWPGWTGQHPWHHPR